MSGLSDPQALRGPCPLALLLLFLLGPSSVLTISFHLPVNSRKCLREEIHKDLLVTGAYEITDQSGGAGGPRTHLKVRPSGARGGEDTPQASARWRRTWGVLQIEVWRAAWPPRALGASRRDRPLILLVGVRWAGLGAKAGNPLKGRQALADVVTVELQWLRLWVVVVALYLFWS